MEGPKRQSASAEAAALRWSEQHPEDDDVIVPDPPAVPTGEVGETKPRRSRSVDAAALRAAEQEADEGA